MWLKIGVIILCVLAAGAAMWAIVPWVDIQHWAAGEQRTFQNAMARALRGIQAGDPLAVWTLCGATAAYGFFHALGPGHGKVLIGGCWADALMKFSAKLLSGTGTRKGIALITQFIQGRLIEFTTLALINNVTVPVQTISIENP